MFVPLRGKSPRRFPRLYLQICSNKHNLHTSDWKACISAILMTWFPAGCKQQRTSIRFDWLIKVGIVVQHGWEKLLWHIKGPATGNSHGNQSASPCHRHRGQKHCVWSFRVFYDMSDSSGHRNNKIKRKEMHIKPLNLNFVCSREKCLSNVQPCSNNSNRFLAKARKMFFYFFFPGAFCDTRKSESSQLISVFRVGLIHCKKHLRILSFL